MIYPSLYNGPVNYFARLIRESEITLEQFDTYSKQSYRNRCRIMGPNGVITLSIPVKKKRGVKNLLRDIKIDYDTPWNKIHWRSLVASYAASPFFEYMKDDLVEFYEQRYEFLVDLNQQLTDRILQSMGFNIPIRYSDQFSEIRGKNDLGTSSTLKWTRRSRILISISRVYHQVFSDRHGFQENLSILDLLFNEGPAAPGILRESFRT